MRIAASGLSPERKIVKMTRQIAIELREAKNPLEVESRPMTASATEARPTNGERKELSSVVFQAKNGKKAVWILSMKPVKEKLGVSRSSAMIFGLITAAMTAAANPMIIMKIVRTSGKVGRVLIVKRKCGCKKAKSTMKPARYIIYGVKIEARSAKAKTKQYIGLGLVTPWIFEPSQSSRVGQKTIMISGVPLPAR